jgi:hypothetical protein
VRACIHSLDSRTRAISFLRPSHSVCSSPSLPLSLPTLSLPLTPSLPLSHSLSSSLYLTESWIPHTWTSAAQPTATSAAASAAAAGFKLADSRLGGLEGQGIVCPPEFVCAQK